ncbi:DUF937 domain-containing protein [Prosthecomicrobium pneumaticum]|uniref:DUF937 domain-containing protein n=1 Tax=Prosthecomicrobium pneumaticum TaxID=81895 RepID=A0A7W9CV52_9HYPH|nr:DUF937 domain-containing protein [Prosthecomicrobium pneumaticum]MBB5752161.1 hypothetical protein [Prosthecomicrobium pneumaticum]
MKTVYDWMRDAQEGALKAMSGERLGLSAGDATRAFEALMPAFWLGMRRSAADPFGYRAFWESLGAGRYLSYFDNPMAAFQASAFAEGEAALERLFGSKDLARAVARQAETMTGIGQDAIQRMMAGMANVMMGGLEKARPAPTFGNPFLAWFDAMRPEGDRRPAGGGPTPFSRLMESWLGLPPEPEPEPEEPMSEEEVVDRLFDAGRSMQQSYVKSMETLFDRFSKG